MKKIFNKKELTEISEIILKEISKYKVPHARVLSLSGDLGAGKTTITQHIAKILDIREKIVSPTFVIMKIYQINKSSKYFTKFKRVVHIDAYRLDNGEELLKIGFNEILKDKDNLIIIEWAERVIDALPSDILTIKLGHVDDNTRSFDF